ncbi:hypothetical protein KOW79_005828 [Hemibagrus wyckioides]|uniref:Uncharacterized protein n=1 Tax=Hemibagrus wyckioides TaxID=337641 RepID=A0A9D3P167_9TELE|nr:hypothetical protein KOW79_005828 [Hemibagrus wyckioides]
MDPGCERVLKRIRPTRLIPKVLEDVEEEMFDPSSSPEDSYTVPLPPTPPSTPQSSQQLSPPRSEESAISGHEEGVVDEGPAGMEVQNGPSDENASSGSDDPDAPLSHWLQRIEFFKYLESAVLHLLNRTLTLYTEEKCNSCRIRHPSQRQHTIEDISTATETHLLGYKSGGSIYDLIYRMYDDITPDE